MDEAQLQYEKRDSVALKRNANGEYAWDVKLYWNSDDADALSVVEHLQHIDKMLGEAFLSG